jgi:hypothetical protein
LRGRWNDKKVETYLDKVGGSDVKNARIIDFITKDAGLNPRKFKTLGDQIPQLLSTMEILYKDYLKSNESLKESSKPKVVTKKEWDRAHPDYKRMIKDKPYMMWFDKKTQSTVFGPVVIKERLNKSITEMIKTYKPGDGEKIADMYASNLKGEERYSYTLRVIDVLVDKNLITKQVSEKLRQEVATQLVRLRKSK